MSRAGSVSPRVAYMVVGVLLVAAFAVVWLIRNNVGRSLPGPVLVGRQVCTNCHEQENAQWSGSHHDLAMQHASRETVLGDFNDATFIHRGVTTTFYTADDRFFVRTDGPDGNLDDFEVMYTFGVSPLQQYLVALPGGRYQALSIAWDSRSPELGGQRWFHLFPDADVTPDHPLHWTRPQQNWNRTCAECHSTNLVKGYDRASDSYTTTWSEIDVSCEACHGPGSNHVAIAEAAGDRMVEAGEWGIVANGRDASRSWALQQGARIATRTQPLESLDEVDSCAPCHARRATLHEGSDATERLLDAYLPSLLRDDLYYDDGQILDEVYEYGSFLQSRMFRAGVTCSDCHDPHSLQLRADGNALCAQCHRADVYDDSSHHFHPIGSTGAQCVECHMPERTYMEIDPRRDHSLRIPRPELAVAIGVPNACNSCHADRSNEWAVGQVERWYGPREDTTTHYGALFRAARLGDPEAREPLAALATDTSFAPIVRATALTLLTRYRGAGDVIFSVLSDGEPLVRLGAAQALGSLADPTVGRMGLQLLSDSLRAIRIEAARVLAGMQATTWTDEQAADIDAGVQEYVETQLVNADHPASWVSLGNLHAGRGNMEAAQSALEAGIAVDSGYLPAYLNLADLLRATGRDAVGETVLMRALERFPDAAELLHAVGLLRVRQGNSTEGLSWLERAAQARPDNGRFAYVYGVALASLGEMSRGIDVLEAALLDYPFDRDLLTALATYHRDLGDVGSAIEYAERLLAADPGNASAEGLLRQLRPD